MRCMNCGLPLSPERAMTNCPRCGASLDALQGARQQQFEQANWGNMGGAPQQNPWAQSSSSPLYNSFTQQSRQSQTGLPTPGINSFNGGMGSGPYQETFAPKRLYAPQKHKANPRLLFIVAGLCIFLSALLLGFVALIGLSGSGNSPQNTANSSANTAASTTPHAGSSPTASNASASATPTTSASPSATGTAYPGQQYIYGAQMAMGVDPKTVQPQQPTTTFKVGTPMYVVFNLHPPSQGGAVCAYWYLNGTQVVPDPFPVKGTSHASYAYATYNRTGSAYVELYWASNTSCSDKLLAQQVNFTVTN